MTCPVSASAYNYVRKRAFGEDCYNLFEDANEALEELGRLVAAETPTDATVRLRCFFAIECAVYVTLRSAFMSSNSMELAVQLSDVLPIERSYEGLTRLLHALEDVQRTLSADQLECLFMGDHAGELGGLNAKLLEKPKTILNYAIRMVRALRPDLERGGVANASSVGEYMARAMVEASPDLDICFYWIRRMLNTSMENPSSWNVKKDCLV